jgi:hypothetical protein
VLWLSERFQWFGFNRHKGWTVLICGTAVAGFLVLMLTWFVAAHLFRLRFQFSVRSLLALMVAVAIPSSWFAVEMRNAKEQKEAVERLETEGAWIDYQGGDSPSASKPSEPAWLRKLLGREFFDSVDRVQWFATGNPSPGLEHLKALSSSLSSVTLDAVDVTDAALANLRCLTKLKNLDVTNTEIGDAGVPYLQALPHLVSLNLWGTKVTDEGLARLEGMVQLRELGIGLTEVTDAGLEHLKGLSRLEELDLSKTAITDAGFQRLKDLRQLRELRLTDTKVTCDGIHDFQHALPSCKVEDVRFIAYVSFEDSADSIHVQRLLTSNGIECRILGSSLNGSVYVPIWDAERAIRLLREDRASDVTK